MRGFVFSMWSLMAAAFVGCAKDVSEPSIKGERAQVEVTPSFSSSGRGTTRAADGLDINLTGFSCLYGASASEAQSPDSKSKVMIDDGGDVDYSAYAYRVTGSSALAVEGDAPMFPSDVDAVNVYGWYPYTADNTFSIQADQSTITGYCLSDLMFANKALCTRNANSVTPAPLAFRHVMSKVKIVLNPDEGVTVKSVKLMNVKPTVTIDDADKGNLEVGEAEGEAGDVNLLSDGSITSTSEDADKTLAAVIPEQTFDAAFIQIAAEIDGTPSTITYVCGTPKTFAKGNEYDANIPVLTSFTNDPTIDIDNPTEIVPITDPGLDLADATVGMIIAENGKAYTVDNYDASYGKKVAIVAYKGNGEANTSFNNGLAIALNDAGYVKWLESGSSPCVATYSIVDYNTTGFSDLNGIAYTNTLATAACNASHDHSAAKVAKNYQYDASVSEGDHPANTSQWFLPTLGQWNLIVKGMCGDHGDLVFGGYNDFYKDDKFNEKITAAGGTGVGLGAYWSSTEFGSTTDAWYVTFYAGYVNILGMKNDRSVCAILAF